MGGPVLFQPHNLLLTYSALHYVIPVVKQNTIQMVTNQTFRAVMPMAPYAIPEF
jgi:hypothetical protein